MVQILPPQTVFKYPRIELIYIYQHILDKKKSVKRQMDLQQVTTI